MAPIVTTNELCEFMKQIIQVHYSSKPHVLQFVIAIPYVYMDKLLSIKSLEEIQNDIDAYWKTEHALNIESLNFGWMAIGGLGVTVTMKKIGPTITWEFLSEVEFVKKMIALYAIYMDRDMKVYIHRQSLRKDFHPGIVFDTDLIPMPLGIDKSTLSVTITAEFIVFNAVVQ